MEAIEEEITARERIGAGQSCPSTRRSTSDSRPPPTAATLVSGESSNIQLPCCYCSQLHYPNDCDTIASIDARKQSLRRSGRCFSCLRRGHLSAQCRSASRCRNCRGRHHTSICENRTRDPSRQQPQSSTASVGSSATTTPVTSPNPMTTHSTLNPTATSFTPPTSTSFCASSNKVVLLQTAVAEISDPRDPCRVLNARIVMDCGSQKSYLTQRVKQILSLPLTSTQQLSIAAFGSSKGEPLSCGLVRLAVRTKSGVKQELDVFVVPHICDPLTTQPVDSCSKMYSHLADLDFADVSPDETLEVDMLIGSDFYWDFVTGRTVRGGSGPVAIETTLGWVLSGPAESSGQRSTVSLMSAHTLRVEGITNTELHNTLQSFWELESLGIQTPTNDL